MLVTGYISEQIGSRKYFANINTMPTTFTTTIASASTTATHKC